MLFSVLVVQTGFGAILPLLPEFVHRHGFPLADMGVMAAAYAAVSFVGQLGLGAATDRIGRKAAMVWGAVVEAAGTAGFLLHGSPILYVFCRVLQGLGSAAIIPAANALVADVVPEVRRGQAYGLLTAASSAGFALGPMVGGLAGSVFGLQAPFVIGAFLNGAAAVLSASLIPRDHGRVESGAGITGLGPIVQRLWLYFLVMFAWTGMNGMYDTTWSLYMRWLGASRWLIGVSFTLFALPLLVFNLWGGRVADRRGTRHRAIVIGTTFQALLVASYVVVRSAWLAIVLSMVEAAAMSLTGPALSAVVMDAAPSQLRGALQGAFQATGTLGAALMALASGPLLVSQPNHPFYLGAMVLMAAAAFSGLWWRNSQKL
ncbi:MFS transporter [Sulfobacillus harzensis]|uniref:MFS transporter n=1 Tax=Sulfobacillus harzensis TaxID=2729629 RepID=A0A7Y0Q181_9FIRM|nr:MFS transporter [Sulfobacillus harzensis]NMP21828.1 MFS transporter [Sulfobacillus harzensis]